MGTIVTGKLSVRIAVLLSYCCGTTKLTRVDDDELESCQPFRTRGASTRSETGILGSRFLASRSARGLTLPIDLAKTFSYLADSWQIQGHCREAFCLSNLLSFPQHNCKT